MTVLSPWQQIQKEFECTHAKEQVVKHVVGGGLIQVKKQCLLCGEFTSNSLKQANYNVANLPYADLEKQEEYRAKKNSAYESKRMEQMIKAQEELSQFRSQQSEQLSNWRAKKNEEDSAWWAKYNCYLQSDHWKQLRASVIRRDSFCCQNCFAIVDESCAHVHHLSYVGFNRVGKSFAFECVTLCRDCHIEFHPHMQAEEVFDEDAGNWWEFR